MNVPLRLIPFLPRTVKRRGLFESRARGRSAWAEIPICRCRDKIRQLNYIGISILSFFVEKSYDKIFEVLTVQDVV
jgi:hypothetical protein